MEEKKDNILDTYERYGLLRGLNGDIKGFVAQSFDELKNEFNLNELEDSANSFEIVVYPIVFRIYRDGNFSTQIPKETLLDFFKNTTVGDVLKYMEENDNDNPNTTKLNILLDGEREHNIKCIDLTMLHNIDLEADFVRQISKLAIEKITGEKEK